MTCCAFLYSKVFSLHIVLFQMLLLLLYTEMCQNQTTEDIIGQRARLDLSGFRGQVIMSFPVQQFVSVVFQKDGRSHPSPATASNAQKLLWLCYSDDFLRSIVEENLCRNGTESTLPKVIMRWEVETFPNCLMIPCEPKHKWRGTLQTVREKWCNVVKVLKYNTALTKLLWISNIYYLVFI